MVFIIRPRKGVIQLCDIGINPAEPFVLPGGTTQLQAVPLPPEATLGAVTWTSSQTGNITVSSSGVITGIREDTTSGITVTDGTFSKRVVAYCGYDITQIDFSENVFNIAGVQGVSCALSWTPSQATNKSFAFESANERIARYIWQTTASWRKMWGMGAGTTTVRVYGKSGHADDTATVTVTAVPVTGIEIRKAVSLTGGNSETTEQGDSIPPVATTAKMIVNQADWSDFPVFFLPYNTTERHLTAASSDESIAKINARNDELPQPYDYTYGTARKKSLTVSVTNAGQTVLTVTPEHGNHKSLTLTVLDSSAVYGSSSSGASGTGFFLNFGLLVPGDDIVGLSLNLTTYNASTLGVGVWSENKKGYRLYFERTDGSISRCSASGYLYVKKKDGTEIQLCQEASYSMS